MIWTSIKKHAITFILVGTVFINIGFDLLNLPNDVRAKHWDGSETVLLWWHGFFQKGYIIGFILLLMNLLTPSNLDKDVIKVYFAVDLMGYLSYMYRGWPEPKHFLIQMLSLGIFAVIIIRFWKLQR